MIQPKRLFLFFVMFWPLVSHANDTPCTATAITTSSTAFQFYSNIGNSDSGIPAPPLGGYLGGDVWFSFTMTGGPLTLLIQPGTMTDPALAIYTEDCNDPVLHYNVSDDNCDGSAGPQVLLEDLTPGQTYYLRIWAENGSGDGDFGLFLGSSLPQLLNFDVFADATIQGDCIALTQAQNGQQGCAWFQAQIDFSQPFTHEMVANFGDKDSGADGICLVYQSNGPAFCGGTGQGIGAGGMPSSAIFEFDTYQNGPLLDPAQDHVSFNINGNMDHSSSIDGPVSLPANIEDGLDHTIVFEWDPAGNSYQLFFDGASVLSGSYDIINNCFGGNNLAYWGYTASTGARNNDQVICPIVTEYEPSTIEYEEVTICDGDSYNGWTMEGLYIEELSGIGSCIHQLHTRIIVVEESPPHYIEHIMCDEESFAIEGQSFTEDDLYTIETLTEDGCDSTIILDLIVIEASLAILGAEDLTCTTTSVLLSSAFAINYSNYTPKYEWNTPNGFYTSDTARAVAPGMYTLSATIGHAYGECEVEAIVEIFIDTIAPALDTIADVSISCDSSTGEQYLTAPVHDENWELTWFQDSSIVGFSDTLSVFDSGVYTLLALDTVTGCLGTTSANVYIDGDIPTVSIPESLYTLDCETSMIKLEPEVTIQSGGSIVWTYNTDTTIYSTTTDISVSETGLYTVTAIGDNGCIATDSVLIVVDTLTPIIQLSDVIIPCDQTGVTIGGITQDSTLLLSWLGPEVIDNAFMPTLSSAGTYHLTALDTGNHCQSLDSLTVVSLGNSPTIVVAGLDTIDCYNNSTTLTAQTDSSADQVSWSSSIGTISSANGSVLIDQAGFFYIEATTSSGCTTVDTIEVKKYEIFPDISIEVDTIDCDNIEASIRATISEGIVDSWSAPDNQVFTTASFSSPIAGTYVLTAINSETGCTARDSVSVIDQSNYPDFSLAATPITCDNPSTVLALSIYSTYQGTTWTYPDGTTSNDIGPTVAQGGLYILEIEVEGSCDVDTTLLVRVDTVPPAYTVDFETLTCASPISNLEINSDIVPQSIVITGPTGEVYGSTTNEVSIGGEYIVSIVGINGCNTDTLIEIATDTVAPEVSIESDTIISCRDAEAKITASTSPSTSYYWSDSSGGALGGDTTITVETAGTYHLEIIGGNGCAATYEVNVADRTQLPDLEVVGSDIDCNNASASLAMVSAGEWTSVEWTSLGTSISDDPAIIVTEPGLYVAEIMNQYGCSSMDSVLVNAYLNSPELVLLSADTITLLDGETSDIWIEQVAGEDLIYDWQPANGLSCSSCLQPTVLSYLHDEYNLTAIDSHGCTTTIQVFVRQEEIVQVSIPNVFSPSTQDGVNDWFTLYGNDNIVLINDFYIYDRWGSLVFRSSNIEPSEPLDGWDGSYRGKPVSNGVYVYYFSVTTASGEVLRFTGDITKL